jgi:hypothetical protein
VGETGGDPHLLRPDHLPTPFSAAEIRDAFQPGREVRSRLVRAGEEPVVRVRRSISGDSEGGVYEFWTESEAGQPLSEPVRDRSTWLELQGHASMPADQTVIEDVTIEVPMGRYEGRRYTRTSGDEVDTFWFAMELPGAPVRFEQRVRGELVFSSTAIEDRRP